MAQGVISGGNPVEDIHTRTSGSGGQSQVVCLGIDGSDSVVTTHATRGLRVDTAGTGLVTGRNTIGTAGAAAQLNAGGSSLCKSVLVSALRDNDDFIAIGDSTVNAAEASERGISLAPGEKVGLDVSDIALVYMDILVDGNGATWTVIN